MHYSPAPNGNGRLPGNPLLLDSRAFMRDVRLISNDLAHRARITTRDPRYATLLNDILGQSHVVSIEVLAYKRRQSANLARKRRDAPAAFPSPSTDSAASTDDDPTVPSSAKKQASHDARQHVATPCPTDAARDLLVKHLYTVKLDIKATTERQHTVDILQRKGERDIDALRRLWGVPKAVFDVSRLTRVFSNHPINIVLLFYDRHISHSSDDARIFNILYWKESCHDQEHSIHNDPCYSRHHTASPTPYPSLRRSTDHPRRIRTVSKSIIAKVVKTLLLRRRSHFFERYMDLVIETVLYGINPDRFVERFRESALRDAGFFKGLHAYEYSRSYIGSLENIQMGKINRMLRDIRSIRTIEGGDRQCTSQQASSSTYLSLRAVRRFCADQDSLTDRVLRRVYERYVRHRSRRSHNSGDDVRLSVADYIRMYLASAGCWTDPGVKYWFSVLDQDGDGVIGVGDVAHFYAERKVESERRNGIKLVDVRWLWVRLCAMGGMSPNGPGLDLNSFKELGKDDREFIMCALLVRRAGDENLINVAGTMAAHVDAPEGAMVM